MQRIYLLTTLFYFSVSAASMTFLEGVAQASESPEWWAAVQQLEATEAKLKQQILTNDEELFEKGYNQCDMPVWEKFISDDFEFYHDQGGITAGRGPFLDSIRRNVCGEGRVKLHRRLLPGTSRLFPLYRGDELYAIVQQGDHSFHELDPAGNEAPDSIAAFQQLWALEAGEWKIRRVLSFDHRSANRPTIAAMTGYRAPLFDKDDDIEALMRRLGVGSVSIASIHRGKLQQLRSYGELSDGNPTPVNAIYSSASLTKPLVSTLVLKLVDKGLWQLDTPLANSFRDPDLAETSLAERLTTRHVLTHRTGLPNWRHLSPDKKLGFAFEPRSQQQYSGEGFEYLRKALEAHFGVSLEDLSKKYLLGPLGMHGTYFRWPDSAPTSRYAVPRSADGATVGRPSTSTNAAASLMTTAGDYARFLIHVLEGADLSDNLKAEMAKPASDSGLALPYGLGWEVVEGLGGGAYALQHTGSDKGIRTFAVLLPESDQGLVVLTTGDQGVGLYSKILAESLPEAGPIIVRRNLMATP